MFICKVHGELYGCLADAHAKGGLCFSCLHEGLWYFSFHTILLKGKSVQENIQ